LAGNDDRPSSLSDSSAMRSISAASSRISASVGARVTIAVTKKVRMMMPRMSGSGKASALAPLPTGDPDRDGRQQQPPCPLRALHRPDAGRALQTQEAAQARRQVGKTRVQQAIREVVDLDHVSLHLLA
jgi:hypothetical protein